GRKPTHGATPRLAACGAAAAKCRGERGSFYRVSPCGGKQNAGYDGRLPQSITAASFVRRARRAIAQPSCRHAGRERDDEPPRGRLEPAIACPLRMHQLLEAAVSHTLAIEQWPVTAHDLLDSRVGHDLLISLISVFTGFKDDPRKDHGFVRARLSELRKRNHAFTNQVITDAFPVIEGAVFFPDPRRLLGRPSIVV